MTKQYKVGIYCRLSVEDSANSSKAKNYISADASVSIENQREYRQGMSLKAFIWAECNDRKQIDSMIA